MAIRHEATGTRTNSELVSSLIDGELDREQAAAVIDALCRDPELQRRWSDLQLVGDALRSNEVAACHVDGFCARVHRALADEPTVLAPPRARPALRRHLVPAAAIAASVAALAFVAVPLLQSPAPQVAAQRTDAVTQVAAPDPAATAPAQKVPAAIANVRAMERYFAAHRELTGGTGLPRAAAYLRPNGEDR